jgi:hypothetical protein
MISMGGAFIVPALSIWDIWPLAGWWGLLIFLLGGVIGRLAAGAYVGEGQASGTMVDRITVLLLSGSIATFVAFAVQSFLSPK